MLLILWLDVVGLYVTVVVTVPLLQLNVTDGHTPRPRLPRIYGWVPSLHGTFTTAPATADLLLRCTFIYRPLYRPRYGRCDLATPGGCYVAFVGWLIAGTVARV